MALDTLPTREDLRRWEDALGLAAGTASDIEDAMNHAFDRAEEIALVEKTP